MSHHPPESTISDNVAYPNLLRIYISLVELRWLWFVFINVQTSLVYPWMFFLLNIYQNIDCFLFFMLFSLCSLHNQSLSIDPHHKWLHRFKRKCAVLYQILREIYRVPWSHMDFCLWFSPPDLSLARSIENFVDLMCLFSFTIFIIPHFLTERASWWLTGRILVEWSFHIFIF